MEICEIKQEYVTKYTPSLLDPISREKQRKTLGIISKNLPFKGFDVWNAYEFTWLNHKGKPEVALLQLRVPAESSHLIESKSLKLYLGSFSNTSFISRADLIRTLETDLTNAAQAPISATFFIPKQIERDGIRILSGTNLDLQDVEIDEYLWNPDLLITGDSETCSETVYTHLFKSLCPMTGQPDFASILVKYEGQRMDHEGLLKYLVSFREHPEFAEQVTERIYADIMDRCKPGRLSVAAYYTRRGGIDINAYRSLDEELVDEARLWRQ